MNTRRRLMHWLLYVIGGLVGVILLLVIVGLLLPRRHQATSTLDLKSSPTDVWTLIRDLGRVPEFWPELKTSVRGPDQGGREVWVQTMKNGFVLPMVVEEEVPPSRLVTRIALEGKAPFGGSWTYQVAAAGGGTRLSLTEDGFVDNPFFRVISKLMGHHATLDSYLRGVARALGETAQPAHRP
jgi:uncharacterized protein YndB with AHSA1/START domain